MYQQSKDNIRAWFVLFGVVFCTFFQTGIVNSLGVLLPVLQEQFIAGASIIGLAISSTLGIGSILGLPAQEACRRSGSRGLIVTIGIISSLGLIIASLASSIVLLVFGILFTSLVFVAETVLLGILPRYFDKYHTVAVSASICGTCLGVMLMPPFTELLVQTYGWRGAMLILGGVNTHLMASGALLKTLPAPRNPEETSLIRRRCDQQNVDNSTEEPIENGILSALSNILETQLLKNFAFIVVLIISGVYGYTFGGWGIYIVSLVQSKGFFSYLASSVATIGGIGKLAMMIALPPLNTRIGDRCLLYISSVLLFSSMVITTFSNSYSLVSSMSALFGIGQGILSVEVYVVANKVVGEENGVQAVAWLHLCYGLVGSFGGFITGWLLEATSSSTLPFIGLGIVSLLVVLSLGAEDLYGFTQRHRGYQSQK